MFLTMGFASVKLRFARHKDWSREPQESLKRAAWVIQGSLWEHLGASRGSLGGLRVLPWAAFDLSSGSLCTQNGLEHTQSWSSSESSEIVTTPTQERHFHVLWRSLEALLGAFWSLLWSLLSVFWGLLGLFFFFFAFYWPLMHFVWPVLGYMGCFRALSGFLGVLLGFS